LKRSSILGAAVVVPLAGLAGRLAWGSRGWPLIHDAPLMHYIAWRIGDGAAPYRDLFDMNFPGVYLLHTLALGLFGAGDAGWRVFDLAWLAVTSLAAAALAGAWGGCAAAGAGLFFAVYHLAGGAWQAGQRDFLLCPFLLLGALAVARWAERPSARTSLVWAGLALGAAITVKPHAGLLAAALVGLVAVVARRDGGALAVPVGIFAAALVVAPAVVVAWLAAKGALAAWREIVFDYLLPLYARLGRPERWTFHRWHVWIPIAAGVLLSLGSALVRRRFSARHAVVALGLAYGVAHYFGQGKGWEYHLYPLAAFAAVALFADASRLLASRAAVAAAFLACVTLSSVLLGLKGVEAAEAPWIAAKARRVSALVADLDGRLAPGDLVQVLDTTDAGIHALLRLRVRQPTRLLYDFHFYHDRDSPAIARLRAEFLAALDAQPPKLIVLFEVGWPAGGYERVEGFEGLRHRLAAYRVDRRGDGYIVYAR
jgi:Dolichyl-phosphate-mannose-protein mannosyltransferase